MSSRKECWSGYVHWKQTFGEKKVPTWNKGLTKAELITLTKRECIRAENSSSFAHWTKHIRRLSSPQAIQHRSIWQFFYHSSAMSRSCGVLSVILVLILTGKCLCFPSVWAGEGRSFCPSVLLPACLLFCYSARSLQFFSLLLVNFPLYYTS